MIYDRISGKITNEAVYRNTAMQFLYGTTLGGICVAVLRLPVFSKLYGARQKHPRSQHKVANMIAQHDMPYQAKDFASLNDFIIRKEDRKTQQDKKMLIAPADSCLLVDTIDQGVIFSIKGKDYTLAQFLKDKQLAQEYEGGTCLIFRLRVYDYHRFCFVDNGQIIKQKRIRGFLDSVNTKATGKFTLSSNYREITLMQTEQFGPMVFAEVGAMLVGRIINTHNDTSFVKGQEKGYFEFGGSTIVLLLKKNAVNIDDDILAHSALGVETQVKYGEKIGEKHD